VIVATDAPLLPHQLRRVAQRAGMGLARTGSTASNGSGEQMLAFSTANRIQVRATDAVVDVRAVVDARRASRGCWASCSLPRSRPPTRRS
jgi:L-aminopeptidase/D-esterase-like protein